MSFSANAGQTYLIQVDGWSPSDYGAFTVLRTEAVPGGLQVVRRGGTWIDVPPLEGKPLGPALGVAMVLAVTVAVPETRTPQQHRTAGGTAQCIMTQRNKPVIKNIVGEKIGRAHD